MPNSLERLLHHPHGGRYIIALGVLLVLPSLGAGLFADDYAHLLRLTQPALFPSSDFPSLFQLFVFITDNPQWRELQYNYSLLPWWTDSQLQLVFFRPLAELSHAFDAAYLRTSIAAMHGHSIVWYSLLLLALYRFYQQVYHQQSLVLLSLLLFAVDASHGFTVAWLANRNALMAALFVLLSVFCFIQAKQRHYLAYLLLSSVCFILALLSAELGISALAIILVYCLVLERQLGWRAYKDSVPFLLIAGLYLLFYRLAGFGAKGSFYLDPMADFSGFIITAIPRFFTAFSMQFNLLPLHLLDSFPLLVSLSGLLIFIVLSVYVWLTKDRLALFFMLCTVLLILPATLAPMQERNLLITGFASCALLALCIQFLSQHKARLCRALAIVLLLFHLPVSAVGMLGMSYAPAIANKPAQAMADSMPADWHEQHIIALGVPMFDAAFLPLIHLWQGGSLANSLWQLSAHTDNLHVQQVAQRAWLLENPQGLLQGADFLLRDSKKRPLQVGQRIAMAEATIDIQAVDEEAKPTAILFTLSDAVKDNWQWVIWQEGSWQPYQPSPLVE